MTPAEARLLARRLLGIGAVVYTGHAEDEMEKDGISVVEVERSLKGVCEPGEWEGGQWRYRFHAGDVWSVAAFEEDEDDGELVLVVTAWRKTR